MQLDKSQPFATQISKLQGKDFENIVASAYYYLGYFVMRNLTVRFDKQTAAEIDVLAKLITPLEELSIAIECKGQTPSFNDLRKFSSIGRILNNDKISLFAYGANDIRASHINFAKTIGINLLKKDDISKIILPILWGSPEVVENRILWINRYLSVFIAQDYLLDTIFSSIKSTEAGKEINKYKIYLYSELWAIQEPINQIENSFEKVNNDYHNFANKIATILKIDVKSNLNTTLELAKLLALEHRIINLFGIARCSISAMTEQGREAILNRTPSIQKALNMLCDYNMSIIKFCNFVHRWLYLWGGVILKGKYEETEYKLLAIENGISIENVKKNFEVLEIIYSHGDGLIYKDINKMYFNYVPGVFRCIGKLHRESLDAIYEGVKLFYEDASYEKMANECLSKIEGVKGLIFK